MRMLEPIPESWGTLWTVCQTFNDHYVEIVFYLYKTAEIQFAVNFLVPVYI